MRIVRAQLCNISHGDTFSDYTWHRCGLVEFHIETSLGFASAILSIPGLIALPIRSDVRTRKSNNSRPIAKFDVWPISFSDHCLWRVTLGKWKDECRLRNWRPRRLPTILLSNAQFYDFVVSHTFKEDYILHLEGWDALDQERWTVFNKQQGF